MTFVLMLLVAQAASAAPPPARPDQKLICKRMAETGSLVGRRKVCYTRAEWDSIAAAARATSQQLQDNNMGRPSGN